MKRMNLNYNKNSFNNKENQENLIFHNNLRKNNQKHILYMKPLKIPQKKI